jgi:O-antigen ligase
VLLFSRVIFCSLIALFPLAAVIYGNYTEQIEGLLECIIFILAFLSVIGGCVKGGWRIGPSSLSYPILGIVVFALVQTFPVFNAINSWASGTISVDPFETRLFALKLLALVVFGELLIRHVTSKRRLLILILVVLAVGVASSAFGLGRSLLHGIHVPTLANDPSFGQFANRNHFAFLMEMTFGLIVGLMTAGWHGGKFLIALAAAGMTFGAVILTNSRGGFLSISVQIMLLLIAGLISARKASHKKKIGLTEQSKWRFNPLLRRSALMAILLVALMSAALMMGGNGIAQRFSSFTEELKPQDLAHRHHTRRREIWSATAQLIKANPIAGVGFAAYGTAIPQYHDATGDFQLEQAHNDYLELLASGGLIAGFLGVWFIVALLMRCLKSLQSSKDPFRKAVCLGSLTGLVGVATHSVVDFGLHIFVNALVFTALTVLAATSVCHKKGGATFPSLSRVFNPLFKKAVTYCSAGACLLIFATGAWATGTVSISRLLSYEGAKFKRLSSTLEAIRLSPHDPEVHSNCGRVLMDQGQPRDAAAAYERALASRPRDYDLWLQLGHAYRQAGELNSAAAALTRAARYAPHYAAPHWEMGKLLLSLGRRDDAFEEFRAAVRSKPELLKDQIDLAWKEYDGDAIRVIEAVQPQNDPTLLALAQFFAKNGRPVACIQVFRRVTKMSERDRAKLVRELMRDKRFSEAHEVWSGGQKQKNNDPQSTSAEINNGSFENDIMQTPAGFDWMFAQNLAAVAVSLDFNESHSGTHSMRLDFSGNSNPSNHIVSQFVLVQPKTRYTLNFATRTNDIISGGLPLVMVKDAADDGSVLAQSVPLAAGTQGWQKIAVEFNTTAKTAVVLILVRRQQCKTELCPVFGTSWFDDFSLQPHPTFDVTGRNEKS